MEKTKDTIASFEIDHDIMSPGIYVSRVDDVSGGGTVTTYDLRFCYPNVTSLPPAVMHSIEHLAAVYFRNHTDNKVIYFGPMGCQTGFYLILDGKPDTGKVRKDIEGLISWTLGQDRVPGSAKKECGNYLLHDFNGAVTALINYGNALTKK